jgi:tetratricopeptide (TPR) repeat protein
VENKHVRLCAAIAALCLGSHAWGQTTEATVMGEVHLDSTLVFRSSVTLRDIQGQVLFSPVEVSGDGRFEFRQVPFGQYTLTVLDDSGRPIHEEMVSLHSQRQLIVVDVARYETGRPPSGAVSAAQLLHPPTKKAFQAFQAARKFAEQGDHDKAAGQLEKAVQLSPEYADAWVNLAVQHILMGHNEQALEELARASSIAKPNAIILGDMAFAQYALHRYGEGASSARQALQLDPSCAPAHYLLGTFLVLDRRTLAEGIQHLEVAARTMPAARESLERARRDEAQVVTHP